MSADRPESIISQLDVLDRGERRRVYCQNAETAFLLKDSSYNVLPLPTPFPKENAEASVVIGHNPAVFSSELRRAIETDLVRLIYVLAEGLALPPQASGIPIFSFLVPPFQQTVLTKLLDRAFQSLRLAKQQATVARELQRVRGEIDELNQIGIALSTERDMKSLLDMILRKSREITNSDAGSLYLIEEDEQSEKWLRFKITQNDSLEVPFEEFTLPIDASSIAGYVALTAEEVHLEDVYQTPPTSLFSFSPKFDQESGYRTKSMLAVPMKNPRGEITGVVQLINCKRDPRLRVDRSTVHESVTPFPEERRALVRSLASQAAVAIENNLLYESIQTLFEGFVKASVIAIEARDPTTSGHSFRVADLTVGLAEAVDRDDSPAFRDLRFTRSELKEIRYACLLHDFGKVGVREAVLVKAKKLYPRQVDLVKQRFDFARKAVQQEQSERKLAYLLENGKEEFLARQAEFQHELAQRLRELDRLLDFVLKCNEPTILAEGNFQRLTELARGQFRDSEGGLRPLLTAEEVNLLAIPKGTLDESERKQIESHVIHSLNFLSQIPWTREIKNIPAIVAAHHERLNGEGYPYRLTSANIPFQSKMMT
ncbi:MAG TPA: HD domain-containing phosphohydrolase, partial [Candidatus Binatia bacterium]|nr:HD domain-containing phosphohydrolase [Candidatus Binatia bacterium]